MIFDILEGFVSELMKNLTAKEVLRLKSCKNCPYHRNVPPLYCTQTSPPTRILSEYYAQGCIFYGAVTPLIGKDLEPLSKEEKQEGEVYVTTLDIPSDTPEDTPESTTLVLVAGTLIRVKVKFPSGCHDMVGMRVLLGSTRLFPKNDEWVYGNDEEVKGMCNAVLTSDACTLTIQGISPSTVYGHKPVIRAEVI